VTCAVEGAGGVVEGLDGDGAGGGVVAGAGAGTEPAGSAVDDGPAASADGDGGAVGAPSISDVAPPGRPGSLPGRPGSAAGASATAGPPAVAPRECVVGWAGESSGRTGGRASPAPADGCAGDGVAGPVTGGAARSTVGDGAAMTAGGSGCADGARSPAPARNSAPASTATPAPMPATARARRSGCRARSPPARTAGDPAGTDSGSSGEVARMRSAVSAAGVRWGRPARSSVRTTWASVARSRASSSCMGSPSSWRWWPKVSAERCGSWVPAVSRRGPLGCRAPPQGAHRRGRGPVRSPGSSSCGSLRG
jgi:hypothetical protein